MFTVAMAGSFCDIRSVAVLIIYTCISDFASVSVRVVKRTTLISDSGYVSHSFLHNLLLTLNRRCNICMDHRG